MASRTYQVGRSEIALIFGDITTSRAEVVVSSDDCYLSMGGGVSEALLQAAGATYRREARKVARPRAAEPRLSSPGDVIVTAAGDLPAKYVLHVVTRAPRTSTPDIPHEAVVRRGCLRVMQLLPLLHCRSVAFPSLGTGFAGIDPCVTAELMAAVLVWTLLNEEEAYRVEIYLLDRGLNAGAAEAFYSSFEARMDASMALGLREAEGRLHLAPPPEPLPGTELDREAVRRFDIYTMLLKLDQRRAALDAEVQAAMELPTTEGKDVLHRLKEQLAAVAHLRAIYEADLALPAPQSGVEARSVFVSSTWEDLQEYRRRARGAVERLRLQFIGMEEFPPTGTAPVDFIRQQVNRAETYVGIVGMRYGFVDPALGFSMTELEYRQAVASRKRRCLFVMSDRSHTPISALEKDPDRYRKLMEFKERVLKENTVLFFDDPEDLEQKLEKSLTQAFS